MRRAVRPRACEVEEDASLVPQVQALLGDGRPQDVAAKLLEAVARIGAPKRLNAAPRTFARALGQAQSTEAENPSLRGHKCGIQAQRGGWDQSIWDMHVR